MVFFSQCCHFWWASRWNCPRGCIYPCKASCCKMLGRGLLWLLCFEEACYYNENNVPLFGLATFCKSLFVLELVYKSHLVNLGQSCKSVFVPMKKKKKGSEQFGGQTWFLRYHLVRYHLLRYLVASWKLKGFSHCCGCDAIPCILHKSTNVVITVSGNWHLGICHWSWEVLERQQPRNMGPRGP